MDDVRKTLEKRLAEKPAPTESERVKSKQTQANIANDTTSGRYIPHVFRVFEDPDFQKDITNLRSELEKLYYKDVSLMVEYGNEHLLLEDKEMIKKVADKYMITLNDLGAYADGHYDEGYADIGRRLEEFGGFRIAEVEGYSRPVYVIGTNTSLESIKKDWPYIRDARHDFLKGTINPNGVTRSKSPDSPDLIFAIFKARQVKKKFSEIFFDYQNSKLAGFKGSSSQFKSEDSLERYYRKYAPQQQKNPISWRYPDLRESEQ